MPGSVPSGTPCTFVVVFFQNYGKVHQKSYGSFFTQLLSIQRLISSMFNTVNIGAEVTSHSFIYILPLEYSNLCATLCTLSANEHVAKP
jgi:hypothetical protein